MRRFVIKNLMCVSRKICDLSCARTTLQGEAELAKLGWVPNRHECDVHVLKNI